MKITFAILLSLVLSLLGHSQVISDHGKHWKSRVIFELSMPTQLNGTKPVTSHSDLLNGNGGFNKME